jgi:hypothetical protein
MKSRQPPVTSCLLSPNILFSRISQLIQLSQFLLLKFNLLRETQEELLRTLLMVQRNKFLFNSASGKSGKMVRL